MCEVTLSCYNLFDTIGKVFPLLFRNREISPEIENHPLSGSPFSPYRFDELEGVIYLIVLCIGMEDLSDEHDKEYHTKTRLSIHINAILVLQMLFEHISSITIGYY